MEYMFTAKRGAKYWLAGTFWKDENPEQKLPQFEKEDVWINGYGKEDEKYGESILLVKEGDILLAKSKSIRDNNSLIINGYGEVLEDANDTSGLKVKWRRTDLKISIIKLGGSYPGTFHPVKPEHQETIIIALSNGILRAGKKQNPQRLNHTLSTQLQDTVLIAAGYSNQGLIGYAYQTKENNTKPLFRRYLPATDDYIVFFKSNADKSHKGVLPEPDVLCHVINEPFPRALKLNRFFFDGEWNHLYATNPDLDQINKYKHTDESNIEGFESAYLESLPSDGKLPLYVYSRTPEILLFTPLEEVVISKQSDVDLLQDNPSSVDELGRKAVMELVFDKISNLWPELSPRDSYTMLLNGEWGSGKSSMLLYLKEFLENDKWTVVEYNAWAHQHLEDQWWVLVNKVSKQISDLPNRGDIASHSWWSFKLQNHNTLVVILLAAIFLASGYGLADFFLLEGDDFTLYGSLIGILGTIWVTFTGIVQNIFKRKVNSATLATNHSSDPYKPIKDRFEEVTKDRKVAIFIDDLDRCEIKPTVELLEGIQNLFKQTKVLYVIAADGNWVSNCFNKKYAEFQNLGSEGHSIGNQFLQKSFQMVVDVPKIGADQHEVLWKKYLGIYKEEEDPNQSEKEEFDDKIAKAKTTEDVRAAVQGDTSLEQRKEAAAKVEELIEKDDHLLLEYLKWVPANPRQMKRLINQFIIKYQSLIIANTINQIDEKALIHYIIFAASYPDYDAQLRNGAISLDSLRRNPKIKELLLVELTETLILELL